MASKASANSVSSLVSVDSQDISDATTLDLGAAGHTPRLTSRVQGYILIV